MSFVNILGFHLYLILFLSLTVLAKKDVNLFVSSEKYQIRCLGEAEPFCKGETESTPLPDLISAFKLVNSFDAASLSILEKLTINIMDQMQISGDCSQGCKFFKGSSNFSISILGSPSKVLFQKGIFEIQLQGALVLKDLALEFLIFEGDTSGSATIFLMEGDNKNFTISIENCAFTQKNPIKAIKIFTASDSVKSFDFNIAACKFSLTTGSSLVLLTSNEPCPNNANPIQIELKRRVNLEKIEIDNTEDGVQLIDNNDALIKASKLNVQVFKLSLLANIKLFEICSESYMSMSDVLVDGRKMTSLNVSSLIQIGNGNVFIMTDFIISNAKISLDLDLNLISFSDDNFIRISHVSAQNLSYLLYTDKKWSFLTTKTNNVIILQNINFLDLIENFAVEGAVVMFPKFLNLDSGNTLQIDKLLFSRNQLINNEEVGESDFGLINAGFENQIVLNNLFFGDNVINGFRKIIHMDSNNALLMRTSTFLQSGLFKNFNIFMKKYNKLLITESRFEETDFETKNIVPKYFFYNDLSNHLCFNSSVIKSHSFSYSSDPIDDYTFLKLESNNLLFLVNCNITIGNVLNVLNENYALLLKTISFRSTEIIRIRGLSNKLNVFESVLKLTSYLLRDSAITETNVELINFVISNSQMLEFRQGVFTSGLTSLFLYNNTFRNKNSYYSSRFFDLKIVGSLTVSYCTFTDVNVYDQLFKLKSIIGNCLFSKSNFLYRSWLSFYQDYLIQFNDIVMNIRIIGCIFDTAELSFTNLITFEENNKNFHFINNTLLNVNCFTFYFSGENFGLYIENNSFEYTSSVRFISFYSSSSNIYIKDCFIRGSTGISMRSEITNVIFENVQLIKALETGLKMTLYNSFIFINCIFALIDWNKGEFDVFPDEYSAIYAYRNNSLTLVDCKFIENLGNFGGAMSIGFKNRVFLFSCTFTRNIGYVQAGALLFDSNNNVTIANCTFDYSTSRNEGGADIYVRYIHYNFNILGSRFTGSNSLKSGGSIYFEEKTRNSLILNSNFIGNRLQASGVVTLGKTNLNISIRLCQFQNISSQDVGTIILLSTDNLIFSVEHSTFEHCYNKVNQSLIFFDQNNDRTSFLNNYIFYCSDNNKGSFISAYYKNNIELILFKIKEFGNKPLITLLSTENVFKGVNLIFIYPITDPLRYDMYEYSLIKVLSIANKVSIFNTTFANLKNFFAIVFSENSNHFSFEFCRFQSISSSKHFLKLSQDTPENIEIIFNYCIFKKNSFDDSIINMDFLNVYFNRSHIDYQWRTLLFNGFNSNFTFSDSTLLVEISEPLIELMNFKQSNVKFLSSNIIFRSIFKMSKQTAIILVDDVVVFERSIIGFSRITAGNHSVLFSIITSDDKENKRLLTFKDNKFLHNVGFESSILIAQGANLIEFMRNEYIHNIATAPGFVGDTFHIQTAENRNYTFLNNSFKTLPSLSKNATFNSDLPLDKNETKKIAEHNKIKNHRNSFGFTSDVRKIELFKTKIPDILTDHHNSTFQIDSIQSKTGNDDCYGKIVVYDDTNNPIYLKDKVSTLLKNDTISVEIATRDYHFCLWNITDEHFGYDLTRGRAFNISMDKIFADKNVNSSQIVQLFLNFNDCEAGQIFDYEARQCKLCDKGYTPLSIHSFVASAVCERCKDQDPYNCYGGGMLSPKPGYARLNTTTKKFYRCPNQAACVGDPYFVMEEFYQNKAFWIESVALGICENGYRGAYCTLCESRYDFGSTNKFKCGDCNSYWTYVKQFLIFAIKVTIFFYSNWKALKNKTSYDSIEKETLIRNIKASYLLKIIFKHFTILNVLSSIYLNLETIFNDDFYNVVSASPMEEFNIFSFECILIKSGITLAPSYAKIIINILYFFISYAILLGFLWRSGKVNNERPNVFFFLRENAFVLLLIFMMDNIVAVLAPFFRILIWVDLGEDQNEDLRLIDNFSLKYWDSEHKNFVLGLSLPAAIMFGVIFPLIIFVKVIRARSADKLSDPQFSRRYGYFVFPYRKAVKYFEVILIFNKIALVLFKEFIGQSFILKDEILPIMAFQCYLIIMNVLQWNLSPYRRKYFSELQKIELFSLRLSISNAVIALTSNLLMGRDFTRASISMVVYFFFTNLLFGLFWLYKYIRVMRSVMNKFNFFVKFETKYKNHPWFRRFSASNPDQSQRVLNYRKLYLEQNKKCQSLEEEIRKLKNDKGVTDKDDSLIPEERVNDKLLTDDFETVRAFPTEADFDKLNTYLNIEFVFFFKNHHGVSKKLSKTALTLNKKYNSNLTFLTASCQCEGWEVSNVVKDNKDKDRFEVII